MTQEDEAPSHSPSLARRITASVAGGVVVSSVAGLTADPGSGLLVGACVTGVLFRDSATHVPVAERLRTGTLVGLTVGLVNAVSASLSLGWAGGLAQGAEVAGAVGVSLGLVWFLAGLILATRATEHTRRTSVTACVLVRTAVAVAGRRSEVITPEGCARELGDVKGGHAAERRYGRGVLRAAITGRLHRVTGLTVRGLDWVLSTDVRLYVFTLVPAVALAVCFRLDFQNLVAVGTVVLFVGEALRDIRQIKPKRLGRTESRH